MIFDWSGFGEIFSLIGGRYLLFAGLAFILAYIVFYNKIKLKKIQQRLPKHQDIIREIGYSVLTVAIFALVPTVLLRNDSVRPFTTYYTDINEFGWFYFGVAFIFMILMHDTYFYWIHRVMHHPAVFKIFHLIHHKSTNPSPWAAYAFHPLEALLEAGIIVIFLFTIPVHKFHLTVFFLFMIIYNVYGHLGWELYPHGFSRNWFGKWINTSVNHNQHHQYFKGNYGLYFLFWDRWMGTIRPDYDTRFDEVKKQGSALGS